MQLANAEKKQSDAIMLADQAMASAKNGADQAMASAEAKFRTVRDEQNSKLQRIQSRVSSGVGELNQICATAGQHLKSQGVYVPAFTSAGKNVSESSDSSSLDLEALLGGIDPMKLQVRNLCQKKKMEYWPMGTVSRLAFVIISAVLFFVFKPLIVLLPAIIFIARHFVAKSLKSEYAELAEASQKLQSGLQSLEKRLRDDAESVIKSSHDSLIPQAKRIQALAIEAANRKHSEAVNVANQHFDTSMHEIGRDFGQTAEQLHAEEKQLWDDSSFAAKDWDSADWDQWSPDASPEFAARIGTLTISADDLHSKLPDISFDFRLPALLPFAEGRCLLFNATGSAKDAVAGTMQSILVRALASTPPGKARFTLIDPVGLGQNVADFMHLGDVHPELISGKAWTEPQHIEQQLTKITEDMEKVIQTYLRTKYATIQDYNKEHHEVAEPFRFLVIFDFPVNFTDSSARRLISIAKNGPRCGVYTLILMDSTKKMPYGFDVEELRNLSLIFEASENFCVTSGRQDDKLLASSSSDKSSGSPVDAESQFKLGVRYASGENDERNFSKAAQLFKNAADQGHATAQFLLGGLYEVGGYGLQQDDQAAVRWFQKAADQENVDAMRHLGLCYIKGNGVNQNIETGFDWLKKAVVKGDAKAQYEIGQLYLNGDVVTQDNEMAVEWFRKSAEQGNAWGQFKLGSCYMQGWGVSQDDNLALQWLLKSAQQGEADAQYMLGLLYKENDKDPKQAFQWMQKAADQNLPEAQCELGMFYFTGKGVSENHVLAAEWLLKAAEKGDADGQYYLALFYKEGFGVAQNIDAALMWLHKAIEQGHEDAKNELAKMNA